VLGIKEGCEIKAAWGYIYALAWLEDGGGSGRNWLISGSGGGDVKIWEVLSGGGLILLTVFEFVQNFLSRVVALLCADEISYVPGSPSRPSSPSPSPRRLFTLVRRMVGSRSLISKRSRRSDSLSGMRFAHFSCFPSFFRRTPTDRIIISLP
jgi:hypothetical protein